ncbi:hypothetical protein PINS_up001233 [Pythium insidiosum]|nr:hypothetical protein PINS_up001233 [Pythium insidiosum]
MPPLSLCARKMQYSTWNSVDSDSKIGWYAASRVEVVTGRAEQGISKRTNQCLQSVDRGRRACFTQARRAIRRRQGEQHTQDELRTTGRDVRFEATAQDLVPSRTANEPPHTHTPQTKQ